MFNVYVSESGGLLRAQQIIAIAEAAGIPCLIGTMGELQIASAAAAHLGVSCANLPFTCDLVGPLRYDESIIREPLRIEDGLLYLRKLRAWALRLTGTSSIGGRSRRRVVPDLKAAKGKTFVHNNGRTSINPLTRITPELICFYHSRVGLSRVCVFKGFTSWIIREDLYLTGRRT